MIQLLDEGKACPGPSGGRWHYSIRVDGHKWVKGDRFFVIDRHGVPRPLKFVHHYTGNGSTVCWSSNRFRSAERTIPVGFVDMIPVEIVVVGDEQTLEVQGLVSDLLDIGEEHGAAALLEVLADGDPDDLARQIEHARAVLDAHEDTDAP